MKPFRIYADTSVFGGCFDPEFELDSRRFFSVVRAGRLIVLFSDIVTAELDLAPPQVRDVLTELPDDSLEYVRLTPELLALRNAYVQARIVDQKSRNDATHVAAATVARADAIVSWNFKHIVQLDRMKRYNQVNLLNGYGVLTIVSPREVGFDEEG